jgi:tRNA U34 5-methylaminomethyl-2-thiouridine-forming methyltransferase MnmC
MTDQRADVDWREGGIPVSRRFDDPYFSVDDGLAETEHVFLAGNGLPGRFGGVFRIGELGFGTGLNCLVTLRAWEAAGRPGAVTFTSFEAFPMVAEEMGRALAAFPALDGSGFVAALAGSESGPWEVWPGFRVEVVRGDVRESLPRWDGRVEAWYLDGFAPAKNPEMWGADVLGQVAVHLEPGGTLATYTAAGHVRRGLAAAGLEVARVAGYGRKRHMTVARKPP